jgi:hypothetical protein
MPASRVLPLGLLLLLGSVACGSAAPTDGPSAAAEARWGFLSESSLVPDAPQYLVNKPRGAAYRVCLPRYMTAAYPGIEAEIFAAVNVWAAYLGRSIPVAIETKELPRARADQSVEQLGAAYHAACGDGFDVVMGLGKIEGDAVGLTSASYQYLEQPDGSRKITAFSRYLFLRDYDLVPTVGADGVAERWTSLAAASGASIAGPELLASMLTRRETRYASGGAYLVLPVLTHELGHVWGLCDQYEGSTNCDPINSSSHPVEASIMGARGATQHLFLTDDDIEGVRALGAKSGFAHDWGAPRADPPAPIVQKPVELARIERVRRVAGKLVVTYGVVTPGAARFAFALQPAGTTGFTPLSSEYASATAIDEPTGQLTIDLGADGAPRYDVKLTVTPASGAPVSVIATEP